jgi:hypothetical protein
MEFLNGCGPSRANKVLVRGIKKPILTLVDHEI